MSGTPDFRVPYASGLRPAGFRPPEGGTSRPGSMPGQQGECLPDFKGPPRVIADREGWEILRRLKLRGCRICGSTSFRVQLHHLVPRGRLGLGGGDDLPENLVPLCPEHHALVEAWDIATRHRLRETLTEDEVFYVVSKKSTEWLAHAYPATVTFCAERGRVERVVAGCCEGCGEPAEARALAYDDLDESGGVRA